MSYHSKDKYPDYNTIELHAEMSMRGFSVDKPSQMSDAFRFGWIAAKNSRPNRDLVKDLKAVIELDLSNVSDCKKILSQLKPQQELEAGNFNCSAAVSAAGYHTEEYDAPQIKCDNTVTRTDDIEGADDETLLAWWVRKVPDSRKNEPLYGEILTLIKKQAKIDSLQSAIKEVPKLEARIAVLEAAIVNVTNRVTKQTDVTESIIVRDAHPSNKMSDGSHVIETLNLHIRDAVDEARAALTNDIEGPMFIDLKTNDQN